MSSSSSRTLAALVVAVLVLSSSLSSLATPRSSCLRSCGRCEQMYGDHFEAHLCAHTCLKLRGRLVPDCADFASIAPFLDLSNVLAR